MEAATSMATIWRRERRRACSGSRSVSIIWWHALLRPSRLPLTDVCSQVVKGTIRDTRQKVGSLVENHEYQYRVCAVNKAGAGNYSEDSDLYKAYDPIGMSNTALPAPPP